MSPFYDLLSRLNMPSPILTYQTGAIRIEDTGKREKTCNFLREIYSKTQKILIDQEFVDKKSPIAPLTWPEEFPTQGWDEYKQFWKEDDPRDVDE